LGKYFDIREGQNRDLSPVMDAIKLLKDMKFRQKADESKARLTRLQEGSPEYEAEKKRHNALVANIMEDLLKPR